MGGGFLTKSKPLSARAMSLLLLATVMAVSIGQSPAATEEASRIVSVVVQSFTGSDDAAAAVEEAGGEVVRDLSIVNGVEAEVSEAGVATLRRDENISNVTPNSRIGFHQAATDFSLTANRVGSITRSSKLWGEGVTGNGVTVAVLDTGVHAAHPDLAGRVVGCKDFSHEAGTEAECADTFGHGTFMAGLVAGNGASSDGRYKGAAPNAKILSVKLAGFDGATDVSHVLAGIQWVVANKSTYGVRVLNLSLGTDSAQSHLLSPLNYAVQRAWKAGIVVVVSAGNSGPNSRTVLKPADDPYVITVGASNDEDTLTITDDRVPTFSSQGPTRSDGLAKPDIVAPGVHTISLRSPGSNIDQQFGSLATVEGDYFRGTGTSMSTATVSGIAAQVLQANPSLSPDQVKHRLTSTARRIADTRTYAAGKGIVDAYAATLSTSTQKANQYLLMGKSTGLGTLDGSRGTLQVEVNSLTGWLGLNGEFVSLTDGALNTVGGLVPWDGVTYTLTGWDKTTWLLTKWALFDWAASSWKASSWKATEWEASSWKGAFFANSDWNASSWKSVDWDASSWKATTWQSAWYAAAWY